LSSNIYDIAKQAGVSIATVSRVFNNNPNVSPKTRERILQVAESLGYHPSAFAQGLARRNSKTIILIVPVLSNYFFMEILAGIQDKIQEFDYDLTIYNIKSFTNNEELREQVEYVVKKGLAEGYILISVHLGSKEWEHLRRFKSPIVLVDEYSEHFDSVSVDSVEGAYAATKHLIDQGAKRVAMISALETSKPISDRIEGYLKALEEAGLHSNRDLIICGDDPYRDGFTEDAGYNAMVKILHHPLEPDACFCASDIQAVGALKAMQDYDKHIPIIGFDDIQIAHFLGLSTMRQPMYDMGTMALDKLMERIDHPDAQISHTVFSPDLILRTTTQEMIQNSELLKKDAI
jgi:LacI family transcriptional regulator